MDKKRPLNHLSARGLVGLSNIGSLKVEFDI